MNLEKLFEMQKKLDETIEKNHPTKKGEDRLSKKVLALLVELSECAQESRCFKFWSNDQKARELEWVDEDCKSCKGSGVDAEGISLGNPYDCTECEGIGVVAYSKNPLLEEFVDTVHFVLSIGNDIGFKLTSGIAKSLHFTPYNHVTTEELFLHAFSFVTGFKRGTTRGHSLRVYYAGMLQSILTLGATLGFTWQQIEQAYYDKNKVNFERQANGY